jgi:hypothetical protein
MIAAGRAVANPLHPTSASWLNAVEGFFSILTRRRLKRGAFTSVADLQDAIAHYIREHNNTPEFLRLDKNRQSHPRHCL